MVLPPVFRFDTGSIGGAGGSVNPDRTICLQPTAFSLQPSGQRPQHKVGADLLRATGSEVKATSSRIYSFPVFLQEEPG
jgi:hypothetical protein